MLETIICIPVTKSVIEILRANMLSPELGTIIARADTAMFRVPTPIRMAFDHFAISFPIMPCIILLIPLKSKANVPSAIGGTK